MKYKVSPFWELFWNAYEPPQRIDLHTPRGYTKITMKYGYKKQTNQTFTETVALVKEELAKEGFGVLTEIDVKTTLKKKLDVDYDNYLILGACNPTFAYKALETEKDIGLLLPCNVIVYETDGRVTVNAILPTIALGVSDNKSLEDVASQVEKKLKKVVDAIVSTEKKSCCQ